MKKTMVWVAMMLIFIGCQQVNMKSYVAADKMTYDAVADEYLDLVQKSKKEDGQPQFDQEQIDRRKRLVESWKMRIDNGEAAATPEK